MIAVTAGRAEEQGEGKYLNSIGEKVWAVLLGVVDL